MGFHCAHCNGGLVFDVESQQMHCEHCGSDFNPQDVIIRDSAIVTTTVTCQNCGAELEGTDESLVGFCPYCGGQSLVAQPGSGFNAEKIIPFQVSKDQCVEAYSEYTKHVPYLHKEFKDAAHIQNFTGIYMPFYQYDAHFDEPNIKGETSETQGEYTVVTKYRVDVELDGEYEHGTPFDASKYLDDEISARCLPFNVEQEVPFSPGYLAGFYADASTAPAELYYEDAQAQAEQDMISEIGDQVKASHGIPLTKKSSIQTTVTNHHPILFPLWFLTWRKGDRVAYAVVNGESGQVVSDLPLNIRAFALGSLAISALLFVVLELTMQMTPGMTAFLSFVAAALMAWGIHTSAKRVHQTQTHAHDKGWTNKEGLNEDPKKRRDRKQVKFKDLWPVLLGALLPIGLGVLSVGLRNARMGRSSVIDIDRAFDAHSSFIMKVAPVLTLAIALYVTIKVIQWHRDMKEWNAPVAIGILLVSVLVNAAIILVAPVDDIWYYAGDIVCIVGLIVSSVAMLRVYNLTTTRPLPKLHDRKEVS